MINAGDLRKGNYVRTEYGICRVAYVIWNDVYVYAKDNRTNYAREVEGIGIGEIEVNKLEVPAYFIRDVLNKWLHIHELQNCFYWKFRKELKIEL